MAENQATAQKPKISISEVLKMLEDGKTRKEIGEHFGLSGAATKALFANEKLKGRKTHVNHGEAFEIEDDAPDVQPLVIKPKKKKVVDGEDASTATSEAKATEAKVEATSEASGW
jgi:hypothetical protein